MNAPYISSLIQVDKCIASIMEALPGDTHYVIMSDQGGHDQTHSTELDEVMNIPVLMVGSRIKQGKNLEDGVSILDVASSILHVLGVPAPKEWV
jgi:phosphopentomutase